ncbi:MAG: type II secretion system protein M [Rhodocyclaceae bacterium]|nr:type II secretion system protein M [Rhodocyclaceae bacterium]MBX3668890.1 type II secretion system protein M [Rhodocyclaceae bacterium]
MKMPALPPGLIRAEKRFDALAQRERVLVAGAAFAALLLLGWSYLIEPAWREGARARGDAATLRDESARLARQSAELEAQAKDPAAGLRARIAAARARLAASAQELEGARAALLDAQEAPRVLEALLARHPGVKLLDLKLLPVRAQNAESGTAPAAPPGGTRTEAAADAAKSASGATTVGAAGTTPALYRHSLEITLEGGYAELAGYLAELEREPRKLYWTAVQLDAAGWPRITMKLGVSTLSLERAWLAI